MRGRSRRFSRRFLDAIFGPCVLCARCCSAPVGARRCLLDAFCVMVRAWWSGVAALGVGLCVADGSAEAIKACDQTAAVQDQLLEFPQFLKAEVAA